MSCNSSAHHITRIAPSPTGDFHIGSARTAYFNWLIARATGGRFVLRIDDTDRARHSDAAVQVIDDAIAWLGLDHDLRVRQSERMPLYLELCDKLVEAGLAKKEGFAVRLAAPKDMPKRWSDTVKGDLPITPRDREMIEGLVILRSDGTPTYHFASVVDDMDLGITWVVRGIDHLSNTAKQLAIWQALSTIDWKARFQPSPRWTHVGLITQQGKKISKRDGAASLLAYRNQGIDPEALLNWLLRLGWGPTRDDKSTKMLDRERALALFLDGGKMRPSPANMDLNQLAAYDRRYKAIQEKAARSAEAGRAPAA